MVKSNKVAELINKRHKIDIEIEDIQKECPHSNISVKSVRERLDSTTMVIRYVCDECYLIVGIPNNDKLQKFLKQ
jgi:hypothetical protein|tara:strand:- start:323 stop:547 length:225 start_codon:yes stop_codon:yes gene_type:complete